MGRHYSPGPTGGNLGRTGVSHCWAKRSPCDHKNCFLPSTFPNLLMSVLGIYLDSHSESMVMVVVWSLNCIQLFQLHGLSHLPGSSVHGILQAITLEWAAISFSRINGEGHPTFCSSPDSNFLCDLSKYLVQFIWMFEDRQNRNRAFELWEERPFFSVRPRK